MAKQRFYAVIDIDYEEPLNQDDVASDVEPLLLSDIGYVRAVTVYEQLNDIVLDEQEDADSHRQ